MLWAAIVGSLLFGDMLNLKNEAQFHEVGISQQGMANSVSGIDSVPKIM